MRDAIDRHESDRKTLDYRLTTDNEMFVTPRNNNGNEMQSIQSHEKSTTRKPMRDSQAYVGQTANNFNTFGQVSPS